MARLKVGVLISGRGSNLQALLDAAADPAFPAEVVLVVSNVPNVTGLARAQKAGVATATVNHREYKNRLDFDHAVTETLENSGVEFVCLAGFMRLVTKEFVAHWHNRMINIHPALLPLFPGLDTHQRALDEGCKLHGCTVHFVRHEMDSGPIVGQAAVPVLPDDTENSLAIRVLGAEHRLYPECLKLIAEQKITISGNRLIHRHTSQITEDMICNP
ncbi:phosphoribosylglycinamide formyltransferase [Kiloniella spongiae]|uniref:Phosphoribosylglycinamide formyltransferase n=1 Tax=Kiloniella spongiae TaxID=1489064 RepID=A0A0H2MCV8_9PROT|nr:phosphoribosylglycinamide formyltransferase [Kiloniella spongiae]KLN60193.1 phosphoribosylglycinamide formyltransferase [Kiloniella spongiae]